MRLDMVETRLEVVYTRLRFFVFPFSSGRLLSPNLVKMNSYISGHEVVRIGTIIYDLNKLLYEHAAITSEPRHASGGLIAFLSMKFISLSVWRQVTADGGMIFHLLTFLRSASSLLKLTQSFLCAWKGKTNTLGSALTLSHP